MTDATGMGPNSPAPRLDPNCQCICHTQPGVMHVAACCSAPSLASSPEVAALIREAEARGMERAAARARVYASNHELASDGRNTLIMLAEWADGEAAAIRSEATK